MHQVIERYPRTILMLVGSKNYGKNEMDAYVKRLHDLANPIKENIIFTGFITPDEIPKFYACGDIFVCTSQWQEPLSRTHYEAMAAGLPIITTNRGGNSEVVRGYGNGWVIDQYNQPFIFAHLIMYLIEHPETALRLGQTGRRLAVENFGWDRVATDLLKLYSEIEGCSACTS